MRLFIAIPISSGVRSELTSVQRSVSKSTTRMKLVEPENLHITMRFIGDAEPNEYIALLGSVKEKKFSITFDRIGAFPNKDYIKVLWAGVGNGSERLIKLGRDIGSKELVPHVTLARVKGKPDALLTKTLETKLDCSMAVEKILLMQSTLTPGGPEYSVVHEIEFD